MATRRQAERATSRAVTRAFQPAEQQLAAQKRAAEEQLRTAQAQLEAQRKQVQEGKKVLTTQAALRAPGGIQALVTRRQRLSALTGAATAISEEKQRFAEVQSNIQKQFKEAETTLAKQKEEARKAALGRIDVPVPKETITITTTPAQFITPVATFTPEEIEQFKLPPERLREIERAGAIKIPEIKPPKIDIKPITEKAKGAITQIGDVLRAAFVQPAVGFFPDKLIVVGATELERRREEIRAPGQEVIKPTTEPTTVAGAARALGVDPITSGIIAFKEAQAKSFAKLREFRQEVKEAEGVSEQAKTDADFITNNIVPSLTQIENQRTALNERIAKGNEAGGFTEAEIKAIKQQREILNDQFNEVLRRARETGIKISIEKTKTGDSLKFSSKALSTDIGSARLKQLQFLKERKINPTERIVGQFLSQAGQAFTVGLAVGATGVGAGFGKAVGAGIGKVTGATLTPAAALGGLGFITAGVSAAKGAKAFEAGKERDVAIPAAILGAGEPIVKTAGFVAGTAAGAQALSQATIRKLERGGLTIEKGVKAGKPAGAQKATTQVTISKTKIPGTKITITQETGISAAEIPKAAKGGGIITTKITGAKGFGTESARLFLVRKGQSTLIITTKAVKGGTAVDTFRIRVKPTFFKKFDVGKQLKVFKLDTISGFEKLGPTEIVKGVKPEQITPELTSDLISKLTGTRLLPGDTVTGFASTQQLGGISPSGAFGTVGGTKGISAGQITEITKKAVGSRKIASLLTQKGGELFPPTVVPRTPAVTIPSQLPFIPIGTATLGPTVTALTPQIAQQQLSATLVGSGLAGGLFTGPAQAQTQFNLQTLALGQAVTPTLQVTQTPTPTPAVGTGQAAIGTQTQLQIVTTPTVAPTTPATTVAPTPSPAPPTPITGFPTIPLGGVSPTLTSALAKVKRQAYDVFVKSVKAKKYRKVGDDLPLGKALKRGATVTKRTIAARFKVVRDKGKTTTKKDAPFQPDPNIFRNYRIVKGQQVPLPRGPDKWEYIERKRKRLTTFGEQREIQFFKRQKGGTKSIFGI